jgi:hypothetical protein
MKKKLFIILTIILACAGIVSGASYYGANSVAIDSNCDKSQYYPLGRLCQDKEDAKLYKGIGSAIEEIGSATFNPTTYANIIDVSPDDDVIEGKRYQTVAAAQAYLQTVSPSPSATNIWGIKIYGTNSENINIGLIPYVHYLGEQGTTRLTGEITSTGDFASLSSLEYVVKNCIITNLILDVGRTGFFDTCRIEGGNLASNSTPIFYLSTITGGTFTSWTPFPGLTFPFLVRTNAYGGTFSGATLIYSIFYGAEANNGPYDIQLSYFGADVTIDGNDNFMNLSLTKVDGVIGIQNGAILRTKDVYFNEDYPDILSGGTWDKVDSHNIDLSDLQGGTTNEYYHLTQSQHSNLTSGNIAANVTGTAAGLSGTPSVSLTDLTVSGIANITGTLYGSAANLTNFPTLNQNTTGTAAGLSGTPDVSLNNLTVAGVASITGAAITGGSGTGITVNSAGHVNRQVYKVTATYAAYSDTDMTKGVVIATLPAKTKLVGAYADTTEIYTGTNVTGANLVVGVSSENAEQILLDHSVFSSSVTKGLADGDMGSNMTRGTQVQGGYFPSWTGTTDIYATINTTGANTDQLTTGSTTFYLVTERF